MFKIYLSRRQTRAMSIDHPIGDPTGGAAYREFRDPATAIVGSNVVGSLVGAKASGDAAKSQSRSAQAAARQLYDAQQASIRTQQQVLEAQLRNADNVQKAQIQNQIDSLNEQLRIAAATRDAQLGVAAETRDAQLGVSKEVLDRQEGVYRPYNEAGLAGQDKLLNYLGIGPISNAGTDPNYGKFSSAEFTPEMFASGVDPGYAFRMKEGLKAVDAQAAARGGLISGAALKASQRFGQDMASQEYQNAFNRYQATRQNTLAPYQQLQGVGLTTAGQISNVLGNYGTNAIGAFGGYGNTANSALGNYGSTAGGAQNAYGTNLTNITGGAGNLINSAYGNYGSNFTGAMTGYGNAQAGLTTGAGNAIASGQVGQANAFNQGISNLSNQYYQNQMLGLLKDRNSRLPTPGYREDN